MQVYFALLNLEIKIRRYILVVLSPHPSLVIFQRQVLIYFYLNIQTNTYFVLQRYRIEFSFIGIFILFINIQIFTTFKTLEFLLEFIIFFIYISKQIYFEFAMVLKRIANEQSHNLSFLHYIKLHFSFHAFMYQYYPHPTYSSFFFYDILVLGNHVFWKKYARGENK